MPVTFIFILFTFPPSQNSRDIIALSKLDLKHKKLELLQKLAKLCGFTEDYQQNLINKENVVSYKKRSLATDERYEHAVDNWRM
jgi:hypothetical protein